MQPSSPKTNFSPTGTPLSRRGFLCGLALVGAGALTACGGTTTASTGPNSSASAVARVSSALNTEAQAGQSINGTTVKMTDAYKFDPNPVTIAKGGTVTWQNAGQMEHSATFDPSKATNKADVSLPSGVQPFDSGLLQPGQTWSHTFTTSGTYQYFCIPHEALGMKGTVIVQ